VKRKPAITPAERVVLITGASSGIGLLTAVTLAQRGWRVLATMRDLSRRDTLKAVAEVAGVIDRFEFHALDVTKSDQIATLASTIAARPTKLDAIINNAGFAMVGFVEDVTDAELHRQFETNFFGATAVTRAFLPQLRRQGSGHIVMISSISGRMSFPGIGSYAASKFALEGWTEALRFELKPLGIHVVLVEPGAFDTEMWTRNAVISGSTQDMQSPNAARIARWRDRIKIGTPKSNPQIVANHVASVLDSNCPRLRYILGRDAWVGLSLYRLLPWNLFERRLIKHSGIDTIADINV
jgi:NAD(P)-dependent dehydrogenase (short-subunit alcohol dehydrogenase family)